MPVLVVLALALAFAFALSILSADAPVILAPVPPEGAAFLHSFEGHWGVAGFVPSDSQFARDFQRDAMRCGGPKELNITIRPQTQDDGAKVWTFRYVPEADGYSYVDSIDESHARMTTWLFGGEAFERHGDRLVWISYMGKVTLQRCTH